MKEDFFIKKIEASRKNCHYMMFSLLLEKESEFSSFFPRSTSSTRTGSSVSGFLGLLLPHPLSVSRHPLLLGHPLVSILIVSSLLLPLVLLGCLLPRQISLIASRHVGHPLQAPAPNPPFWS